MAKPKLTYKETDKRNFTMEYIEKPDPKGLPSTFYAMVVYFPETEEETETFSVQISLVGCNGRQTILNSTIQDEFDTAKEAKKWIEFMFKEFLDILKKGEEVDDMAFAMKYMINQ